MGTNEGCPVCTQQFCEHDITVFESKRPAFKDKRPKDSSLKDAPGEHGQYSALIPEPITIIESWQVPYHIGNVIKYVARWERKGGLKDLKKARWYLDRFIDLKEQGR